MDKKRTVGLMLISVLIGVFIGAYAFASDTPTWVLEDYSLMSSASYIIGKIGDTTYVRDGTTGEVWTDYESDVYAFADARTKAYNDGGGLIFVKAGTYTLTLNMRGKDNVHWKGEGQATQVIGDSSSRLMGVAQNNTISNMAFYNVRVNPYYEDNYTNVNIHNNWFFGTSVGVQVSYQTINLSNVRIENNHFSGLTTGIKLEKVGAASYTTVIERVQIRNNEFVNCGTAIKTVTTAGDDITLRNLMISGNLMDACTGNATVLKGASNIKIENCSITFNHIFNSGGYGIAIQNSYVYNTWIFGNYFQGNTNGAIYDAGTGTNKTWAGMGV